MQTAVLPVGFIFVMTCLSAFALATSQTIWSADAILAIEKFGTGVISLWRGH